MPLDPRADRRDRRADRRRASDASTRARRPAGQAGVELPRRRPAALGDRQHPRGDGPAARLLLPGDRRSRSHLHGPGIEAQGAAVPGMAMYILIGRTPDYAWSLTSANHDVRDVFAEQLCEPDGSAPTRASDHYLFNGRVPAVRRVRRGHAERHADPLPDVGARPGDRHRDRAAASRSRSPASARRSAATV